MMFYGINLLKIYNSLKERLNSWLEQLSCTTWFNPTAYSDFSKTF